MIFEYQEGTFTGNEMLIKFYLESENKKYIAAEDMERGAILKEIMNASGKSTM